MITNTKIEIPKKYQDKIEELDYEGRESGYWAYTKKGFMFELMGCHTAHEYSKNELLKVIRTIVPCECEECKL